jgi:hypothetical protein
LAAAAEDGQLDIVRFLVELDASIEVADNHRDTALQRSICGTYYSTAQFLLEHAGANIESVGKDGKTARELLIGHLLDVEAGKYLFAHIGETRELLTALLRVMVLRGALPPIQRDFFAPALLTPENTRVMQEGTRLRVFLLQQR